MSDTISKEQLEKTVRITKQGALVNSLQVAKIFEKQHKDVLRTIREKIKFLEVNSFHPQKYFKKADYIDSRGKTVPRYDLTRKGFDYIILSFKGKKAELYKLWYIDEFHRKTEIIESDKALAKLHKSDDLYIQFRRESKDIRKLFTEVIRECELPQRITEGKDASKFLGLRIMNYTRLVYKILGIEIPKGDDTRDVLDIRQLVRLEDLEKEITTKIRDNATNNIHYKESYMLIKKEYENLI